MTGSAGVGMGPGGEFDLIRMMLERWGDLARGIGDDAALLDVPRGERLVVSTDASVEGRHFRRHWLTPTEIGQRAVAAALSDLAAMAATPLGVLVSLALPDGDTGLLPQLADGIGQAVRAAGTVIVGGNMTAAAELSITTTVLGSAHAPLTRSGARAGDALYVTGRLGGPAAALAAWNAGLTPAGAHRQRFAAPAPRLVEARWLARAGATAAIDISDGLAAEVEHLAAASGVRVELDPVSVPVMEGATFEGACAGGEEYELLVAAAATLDVAAFMARFGVPLTRVGTVLPRSPDTDHRARVVGRGGHDHFSR
jgi:thiamine-monophosphate kinase